jgi:dihydroflavonol-4-reductase
VKIIDKSAPVLVTGATGYVAGWLVKSLLEEGITVHAAVRNPEAKDKLKYLNALAETTPGEIHFFKADLMNDGSYAEAMAGCELVFHTASPFKLGVSNPLKELIEPAKLGTRNVLHQANNTSSVKRVVVTSSCAAIYGDNADLENIPDGTINESIWNTSSSLAHQPYSYSKTIAEHEAWQIAEQQTQWDLVTINPSLVIGPGINPYATSESFNLIKQMGDGRMKTGVPRIGLGAVDVRDLANAHFKAGFTPEASGRYIVSGHNTDFLALASLLLNNYGDRYPIPRRVLPKWLVWLVGPLADKTVTRKVIARNVNLPWRCDNSKGKRELGITYRPLQESMEEFFQQMIDGGLIPERR